MKRILLCERNGLKTWFLKSSIISTSIKRNILIFKPVTSNRNRIVKLEPCQQTLVEYLWRNKSKFPFEFLKLWTCEFMKFLNSYFLEFGKVEIFKILSFATWNCELCKSLNFAVRKLKFWSFEWWMLKLEVLIILKCWGFEVRNLQSF